MCVCSSKVIINMVEGIIKLYFKQRVHAWKLLWSGLKMC